MMPKDESWTVWGDGREPELEASERDCQQYVEARPKRSDLYIADPDGNEWSFENERWIKA